MSENEKILVVIDKDLLKKVEDFRYDNRIPSRSETIRELIKKGLKTSKKKK
jgi:metal-responsive CopG/Arc/MetJ family transcriptional regulator